MSTLLIVLAVFFLLAGATGAFLAVRLSAEASRPSVAERRRRLTYRLAIPACLMAVVLFVLGQFVL